MDNTGAHAFKLPPLILHPFSTPEDNSVLLESSRANLAIQGFLPTDNAAIEDLDRQLIKGRYAEIRMLFYIGKDLCRWTEQCTETVTLSTAFDKKRIRPETFAVLLVQNIPAHIRSKLESWGVLDFAALFRRAIGMHTVFSDLPVASCLTLEFLRRYHRHLDQWYEYKLKESTFDRPEPGEFTFDLFASGEYTMMLEQSWEEG